MESSLSTLLNKTEKRWWTTVSIKLLNIAEKSQLREAQADSRKMAVRWAFYQIQVLLPVIGLRLHHIFPTDYLITR